MTRMESVISPLNIIANYIVQNQGLKVHVQNRKNITSDLNANQVFNQSSIVIHQIEYPSIFRKKYSFEIFIEQKLPDFDKTWRKITQNH